MRLVVWLMLAIILVVLLALWNQIVIAPIGSLLQNLTWRVGSFGAATVLCFSGFAIVLQPPMLFFARPSKKQTEARLTALILFRLLRIGLLFALLEATWQLATIGTISGARISWPFLWLDLAQRDPYFVIPLLLLLSFVAIVALGQGSQHPVLDWDVLQLAFEAGPPGKMGRLTSSVKDIQEQLDLSDTITRSVDPMIPRTDFGRIIRWIMPLVMCIAAFVWLPAAVCLGLLSFQITLLLVTVSVWFWQGWALAGGRPLRFSNDEVVW